MVFQSGDGLTAGRDSDATTLGDSLGRRRFSWFSTVFPVLAVIVGSAAHLWRIPDFTTQSFFSKPPPAGEISTDAWIANYEQVDGRGARLTTFTISDHAASIANVAAGLPEALASLIAAQLETFDVELLGTVPISVSSLVVHNGTEVSGQIDEYSARVGGDNYVVLTRFGDGNDFAYDPPLRYPTRFSVQSSWSATGEVVGRGRYTISVQERDAQDMAESLPALEDCRHFEILLTRDLDNSGRETTSSIDTYCQSRLPVLSRDLNNGSVIRPLKSAAIASSEVTYLETSNGAEVTPDELREDEALSLGMPREVIEPPWQMKIDFPPAVTSESVVVFDSNTRRLVSYDRKSGEYRWSHVIQPEVVAVCGHASGTIVTTSDRRAWSFNNYGGLEWEYEFPDIPMASCGETSETVVVATVDGSLTEIEIGSGTQRSQSRLPMFPDDIEVLVSGPLWTVFGIAADGEMVMQRSEGGPQSIAQCGASAQIRKWSGQSVLCASRTAAMFVNSAGESTAVFGKPDAPYFLSVVDSIPFGFLDLAVARGSSNGGGCPSNQYCLFSEIRGEEGRDSQSIPLGASRPLVAIRGSELVVTTDGGILLVFGGT
ncbi:MAG: PQQ-binding-like beta-propeller repeat protein [Actinomycetota bacterium]